MELVKGTGELLLTKLLLSKKFFSILKSDSQGYNSPYHHLRENLATGEGENKDWAERVDENEEKKEGEVPEEETPNFMTLEEYKALKSQINKRNDFNIRRPGEGEDQSKWGKTYVLPKKADEEDEEEEEEEEDEDEEEVMLIF